MTQPRKEQINILKAYWNTFSYTSLGSVTSDVLTGFQAASVTGTGPGNTSTPTRGILSSNGFCQIVSSSNQPVFDGSASVFGRLNNSGSTYTVSYKKISAGSEVAATLPSGSQDLQIIFSEVMNTGEVPAGALIITGTIGCSTGSAGGAAGGDLTGTYPDPTLSRITAASIIAGSSSAFTLTGQTALQEVTGSAISVVAPNGGVSFGVAVAGHGGSLSLRSGTGGAGSGIRAPGHGGLVTLQASAGGAGTASVAAAVGGLIAITAGNAGANGGSGGAAGGSIAVTAGNGTGSASGGAITITSGNGTAGGAITVDTGTGGAAIQIGETNATSIGLGRIGILTLVGGASTISDTNANLPTAMLEFSGANGYFVSGVSHTTNVTLVPGEFDIAQRIDLSTTGGGFWDSLSSNTVTTAQQINFKGGVKGTKCITSAYIQGLGVGDCVTTSSVLDIWGGITPQNGGSSVATGAGEAVGEFDMAVGGARYNAFAPVPVQSANTAIFQAVVAGSPSAHATTISYTATANSDKLGCRFILNKSHTSSTGFVTAVSLDFSNLQTVVTFSGTTWTSAAVGRYLKIGSATDLYTISTATDLLGDDVYLDGKGVGHWFRIKACPGATQLTIEGIWDTTGFPHSYTAVLAGTAPYLVMDGVEISSYTSSTITVPTNTNTWSNGDILYSPPHHYQAVIGLNIILQKLYRNTGLSLQSDAIRVRSIGLSPLDTGLRLTGTTIDGYGGFTRGIEMIGFLPDVAIDMSGINANVAHVRIPQNGRIIMDSSSLYPSMRGTATEGIRIEGQVGQISVFATDAFNSDLIIKHTAVGRVDLLDATSDTWLVQRQGADVSIGPGGFGSQSLTVNASKVVTNKGIRKKITTTAITYTILVTDEIIMVEGISGTISIHMPASPNNGDCYTIKDSQGKATLFNITIDTTDASTIDGSATFVMNVAYQSLNLVYDSFHTSWAVV